MQPSPLTLNEFESAILLELAVQVPALTELIPKLKVTDRQYTPCGSYTNLECEHIVAGVGRAIGLRNGISVPGVAYGMDGLLFFKEGKPEFLEIVTFGGETWDGRYDGFSIPPAA